MTESSFSTVYVSDVDVHTQEGQIWQAFAQWSPGIRSVCIIRNNERRPLGHAYVNFFDSTVALEALRGVAPLFLNSSFCPVYAYDGVKPPPRPESRNGSGVFVKNLAGISVSEFYAAFQHFGTILACRIATEASGLPRGFGYITFATKDEAERAIAVMDGHELKGNWLSVTANRPPPNRGTRLYLKFDNRDRRQLQKLTEEDVEAALASFGQFDRISFIRNDNGCSRGFAFASTQNIAVARQVIAQLHSISGVPTTVSIAAPDSAPSTTNMNLFLKPLAASVTERDLYELFGKFGGITSTKIMKERGFGFLSFDNAESAARAAAELNGIQFHGETLSVGPAISREPVRTERRFSPTNSYTAYAGPVYYMPTLQQLGESLYPVVIQREPDETRARYITGIILQQPIEYILAWLQDRAALDGVVAHACETYEDWLQKTSKQQESHGTEPQEDVAEK